LRGALERTVRRAIDDCKASVPGQLDGNSVLLELDDKVIPGSVRDTVAGPIDSHFSNSESEAKAEHVIFALRAWSAAALRIGVW